MKKKSENKTADYKTLRALLDYHTAITVDLCDLLNTVASPSRNLSEYEREKAKQLRAHLDEFEKKFSGLLNSL